MVSVTAVENRDDDGNRGLKPLVVMEESKKDQWRSALKIIGESLGASTPLVIWELSGGPHWPLHETAMMERKALPRLEPV